MISHSAACIRRFVMDNGEGAGGFGRAWHYTCDEGCVDSKGRSKFDPPTSEVPIQFGLSESVAWQESRTSSFVSNAAAEGLRSRLTDGGRRAFSANASTDLADNMTFSLQGSRVVNFDRNFNRKLVQTVFSAALQLQFFGGAMK